ncbi:MAG: aspartate 1-decarboxylase [Alicyclobacillus sp.]|nr:aspartate 1-decarboxylase [Alicyclobacillus sp.]
MLRTVCKGKIHRAVVTQADLNYVGSITIDRALMDAADIHPYEMVQVTNLANGVLWQTYALPAPPQSGTLCLNGPPARLFQPGDKVIVLSLALVTEDEWAALEPKVVFVDDHNQIEAVLQQKPIDL